MSAMCEVPVRVVDELPGVECRVAFLSAACQALCEQPELARGVTQKAWEGLFYWTLDLEAMLRELNEQVSQSGNTL